MRYYLPTRAFKFIHVCKRDVDKNLATFYIDTLSTFISKQCSMTKFQVSALCLVYADLSYINPQEW